MSPTAAPHRGGRHKYNGVLPGAPRRSFTTPAIDHPSATQPSARCLTPWLRWFGPVKKVPSRASWTKSARSGGEGYPHGNWECDTCWSRSYTNKKSPLWVVTIHPSFPPLHMSWLNRFRVLCLKACGTLSVLKGDSSSSRSYPIRVFSRIRPGHTVVIPE
jgi:hypothetical protein